MQRNTSPSWLGIELRHLAALQAVAEERSFVRAADRLGYTQSAISNQIAALERLVGSRLVERTRGGGAVALTDSGRVLYEHAQVLIPRLHAARSDVSLARAGSTRALRLGSCHSVAASVLPLILQAHAEQFPCQQLELELGFGRQLEEAVTDGRLDVAIVAGPPTDLALATSKLFDDPLVLLASEERRLLSENLTRPLLAHEPCPAQREHEAALRASLGVPDCWIQRLDDSAAIHAFVAAGWGLALLPSLAVNDRKLVIDVLPAPAQEIHIVWQRERSIPEALEHLIETAAVQFSRRDDWLTSQGMQFASCS